VTREVVLAPGLWMPAGAMALLSGRLARAGYTPHVFAYRGRSPFDANIERLARFAHDTLGGRPAHFVGHSLGGVLILDMLNAHREIAAASVVLLGAPVRGCLAGRRLGAARVGRWMMGACGSLWGEREARWRRDAPLGVVAGTLPLGLGRVLGRLPDANDGVVRVAETEVAGMRARALVPQGHSMLIVSGAVGALVERFFASGSFA
jgi:pimeloyl-ACP methyl ester carboxylesterase